MGTGALDSSRGRGTQTAVPDWLKTVAALNDLRELSHPHAAIPAS